MEIERNNFSEKTRAQIPALIHLRRLGYIFRPKKNLNWDKDTNILLDVFKESIKRINKNVTQKILKIVKKECYIVSNNLRPIEPRTYRELFKKTLIRLDIKPLKFHCLRHTFATRCVATNSDYKTISCILGHSSIATTMNLYVHPNSEQKKKCIEKMIRDMI